MTMMGVCKINLFVILFSLSFWLVCSFELTILHNNDFHSHYAPMNQYGGDCKVKDEVCYGGVARTVYKETHLSSLLLAFNQIQKNNCIIFFLMSKKFGKKSRMCFFKRGDHFQGTVWYTFFKWEAVAQFVELMDHDAMALGNHEFDDGVQNESTGNVKIIGLAPFVQRMTPKLSIISSNIDVTQEPLLKGKIHKSVVKVVDGKKIAIIGYTTPETVFSASPGKTVVFSDEIESIRNEINYLKKNDSSINIFIALGHSGFAKDIEIAESIPELDVVVGGHTNTFLYTGTPPSTEKPQDKYPVVINHKDNSKTLVVQAFAYGKYLGNLFLKFDEDGKVVEYSGNPILLDKTQKEDPETLEKVKDKAKQIEEVFGTSIGFSNVNLTGDGVCRLEECNLGNVFTDAMVYHYQHNTANDSLSKPRLAIVNGGVVRAGVPAGDISMKQIITAFPFGNTIGKLNINGSILWQMFETSVATYDPNNAPGRFLQVSGIQVKYNILNEINNRVVEVSVLCSDCDDEKYEALDMNETSEIIMTEYIAKGGDGYSMLSEIPFSSEGHIDYNIVYEYINKTSPIKTTTEQRILISYQRSSSSVNSQSFFFLSLILLFLISCNNLLV